MESAKGDYFHSALLWVMYWYGLRASEACRLNKEDYLDGNLVVRRKKGGRSRVYSVPGWLQTMFLDRYLRTRSDESPALFVSGRRKKRITYWGVYYIYKMRAKQAKIPLKLRHPHSLRHSIAVHMLNDGYSYELVKERLGHASIQTTHTYAKFTPKTLEDAWGRMGSGEHVLIPGDETR